MMATMLSLEDPEVRAQVEAALAKAFTAEAKKESAEGWTAAEMVELRRFLALLRIQGGEWYVTKRGRLRRRLAGRTVCPLTSVHYEAEMSCRPSVSARPFALGLYKSAARCLGIESEDLAVAIAEAADGPADAPFVPDPERGLDEPAVLVSLRGLLEKATKVARW